MYVGSAFLINQVVGPIFIRQETSSREMKNFLLGEAIGYLRFTLLRLQLIHWEDFQWLHYLYFYNRKLFTGACAIQREARLILRTCFVCVYTIHASSLKRKVLGQEAAQGWFCDYLFNGWSKRLLESVD